MFKRWLIIVFSFMFLVTAACSAPAEELPNDLPVIAPEESPEEQPQEKPEETPEQTPEDVPVPSILDGKERLDGVIWRLPNAYTEQGVQQHLELFGGNLLVYGAQYQDDGSAKIQASLLSLETGEVLATTPLSLDWEDVRVCGDRLAVTDWSTGTLVFLDTQLQEISRYETGYTYGVLTVNRDGTKVFCVTKDTGVRIIDLQTGETSVLLENAVGLFGSTRDGNYLPLTYTDRQSQLQVSAVLDLERCTVLQLPFEGAYYGAEYADGLWLAGVFGDNQRFVLGKENRPYTFLISAPNSTASFLQDPARILVRSYQENGTTLFLYGSDGSFFSRGTLEGTYCDSVWSEADGGYYITATDATGHDLLLFWDQSVPVPGKSLELEPVYEETLESAAVSQELYDRAKTLGDTYGVSIRIAEQLDAAYSDFTATPEFDEAVISAGLDAVEAVLARLPENLLPQLRYGTQQGLEVHLAGGVGRKTTAETVSGFTSFAGFTEVRSTETVIVLDIARPGTMEQTFCHEIAHVIDSKLAFDAGIREDALYSEEGWMALNPKGFVYAETYDEMPESYFSDGYEDWFLDLYSRTYAKEDRARILEHVMMGHDWAFGTAQRQAKRDYLLQCIYDCFDTTGWQSF